MLCRGVMAPSLTPAGPDDWQLLYTSSVSAVVVIVSEMGGAQGVDRLNLYFHQSVGAEFRQRMQGYFSRDSSTETRMNVHA